MKKSHGRSWPLSSLAIGEVCCQIIKRDITEHTHAQEPYQVHLFQTVTSTLRLIYTSPNDTYGAIYLVAVVV